jgi:hypothetical protein
VGTSNGQANRRAIADARQAEAEQGNSLAALIGQTVALQLAPLLGDLVQRVTAQPECFFCLMTAKETIAAYMIRLANAKSAGEVDVPPQPDPPAVNRSVTRVPIVQVAQGPAGPMPIGCSVPACWDHILNPPTAMDGGARPVSVGLIDVAGRPISFRRG